MKLEPFLMERMQSTYENLVDFNLSESGVQPLQLRELLDDPAALEGLLHQALGYTQSNGTPELRAAIAALYPGATIEHIQVTNGGSEANFITIWTLLEPDDEIVLMVPNYMQSWGLARSFGRTVHEWRLYEREVGGRTQWSVDTAELETLVNRRTKLLVICNPNNPTGARLGDDHLDTICAIAARHGTWVMADEIYRGAELDGMDTPSVWGRYDRAIITSGLSKAYGLPGLRIGWIVAPPGLIESFWSSHDYTTIAPGALSDRLARIALSPERRAQILSRTRTILLGNYPIVNAWLQEHGGLFHHVAPDAGAIVYTRYEYPINSTDLVTRLRENKSVLIVPGDHFGMDRYLRIGYGLEPEHLRAGLGRLHDLLVSLAAHVSR